MSFKIETGLFLLDEFTDCHAIIGVSIEADAKTIRKRYLKVAQRLHPDSLVQASKAEKDVATQVFSKMVGPAYNTLSKERDRKEYLLLIGLKGKQAIQQRTSISDFCEEAKTLASSNNIEADYETQLQTLVAQQYEDLNNSLKIIGQLSELNLVYLMRREAQGQIPAAKTTPQPAAAGSTSTSSPASGGSAPASTPSAQPKTNIVDGYLRRADEYMTKNAYAQAILELRDALNVAPKDSRCHSLMGMVYLKQNQLTMAKVSIKRALELNPTDTTAIKAKVQLERLGQKFDSSPSGGKGSSASKAKPSNTTDKKGGGGLFGGLFGGKK